MKTKIISLLMLATFITSAFTEPHKTNENDEVIYSEVIRLDEMSKKEIYQKAKLWIVSTLKSGDNMVELDGSNSDQIVGTGNLELNLDPEMKILRNKLDLNQGYLNFKFIVFCKDGRLKYVVENFRLVFTRFNINLNEISTDLKTFEANGFGKKQIPSFKEYSLAEVDKHMAALISDFKSTLLSQEEDDW